jgi:hypothetical protein
MYIPTKGDINRTPDFPLIQRQWFSQHECLRRGRIRPPISNSIPSQISKMVKGKYGRKSTANAIIGWLFEVVVVGGAAAAAAAAESRYFDIRLYSMIGIFRF